MISELASNNLSFTLIVIFLLSLIIQLYYFWFYFSRLAFLRKEKNINTNPELAPVSIILCAHNEYHNLEKNIPLILAQKYPNFELVVVNDCSDDGSDELLEDIARNDHRLKNVILRQSLNFFSGKKFPLSIGIKSASYEHLLLTDADCSPASKNWINNFMQNYTPGTDIVLGFSPYKKKRGLLNWLIQFDTLHIGIQYLSLALAGKVYMGVGRNLSYKKSVFLKNKGFTAHYDIPSGDDDLFISQVGNASNTSIEISAESHMLSEPKTSISNWIRQKRRHLSTGIYYKRKTKQLLGLYFGTQLLFYGLFVALLFTNIPVFIPLIALGIRFVNQFIIFVKASKKLDQKFTWLLLPFAELFFIIFNPLLSFSNLFSKPVKWN